MPLYEYACEKCGKVFEVMQKFADEPLKLHAECGGKVDRLLSAPALHFKGSGFYITDYAKGNANANAPGKNAEGRGNSENSKSEGSKSEGSKSDGSKSDGSKSEGARSEGSKSDSSKSDSGSSGSSSSDKASKPAPATTSGSKSDSKS
jgi:putative FmdB family regulatory protein